MTQRARFKITSLAAYYYGRTGTWSFSWRGRFAWLPDWWRAEPDWGMHWGWFVAGKLGFDPGDDYGVARGEQVADALAMLSHRLSDDAIDTAAE